MLARNRLALAGGVILGVILIVAAIGPLIAPHSPTAVHISIRNQGPSAQHWFGTDDLGRDTLSRVLYGDRISVEVGVIAVGIACILGIPLGAFAGFYRGACDEIIMRFMDLMFAFPPILLAIAILAFLGAGTANAMIAIGIVYTPIFARITRASVLAVREQTFVEAARASGVTNARIIWRHVLPNVLAPLIVQATLSFAFAILAEAALSFLGLGTPPPTPSWGRMLSSARSYLSIDPWMAVFPGLAIMLAVMGCNFLGDGLRDALDPRLQQALGPQARS